PEDVDEDAGDVGVGKHELEAGGHRLRGGTAADVEEVRGRLPAVAFPGGGDDIEGRHDQSGTVADDADRTVERDVLESLRLGATLDRVEVVGGLGECRAVVVAEGGVVVEGDLRVEGNDLTLHREDERVDLD